MRLQSDLIRLAATDLSNHLACRHLTSLDLSVARGEKRAPEWAAPDLVIIQERGKRHEATYLAHLKEKKNLPVVNLQEIKDEQELLAETRRLMEQGVDVIAQGALTENRWFGRPDVLRRVEKGGKWDWSYEVVDTKLARETKAATILQLSLYSELLGNVQGCMPEWMWVVAPGNDFTGEAYRVTEYAAYFRYVRNRLARAVHKAVIPAHIRSQWNTVTCAGVRECDAQRRGDDHLSLVWEFGSSGAS